MNVFLAIVKCQFGVLYLDDIVNFSKTPKEHLRHTRKVLTLLNNFDVTMKLKMCHIFTKTMDYFGHVTSPRVLKMASHKTDATSGLPELATINERSYSESFATNFDVSYHTLHD